MNDGEVLDGTLAARWQLPAFDSPHAAPVDRGADAARIAHEEELARNRGHADGYAAGYAAGMAAGRAGGEAFADKLARMLDALARPMSVVDAEVERVLLALTLEAARRIAQQELEVDPKKVAAVVHDAVTALGNHAQRIRVHVHPDDHAALVEALGARQGDEASWQLVADPEVLRGGCRVESDDARVNASLDARAAGIAHHLLGGHE